MSFLTMRESINIDCETSKITNCFGDVTSFGGNLSLESTIKTMLGPQRVMCSRLMGEQSAGDSSSRNQ